jgi:hypothetical protein
MTLPRAVDLTNCDREPIHIPGSVQSHGVLLVCGGSDRRIEHASANTQSMLGEAPERLLGKSLATVIGPAATIALMNALEITQDSIKQVPVPFFFEGASQVLRQPNEIGKAPSPAYVSDFLASSDGLALAKAFTRVKVHHPWLGEPKPT